MVCLVARGAWAQPELPLAILSNFPGGNIVVECVEGDTVHLRPDLRDTEGWWFYWNFKVASAAGRTLTFDFGERSPIGVRGPAVSTDGGATWFWLGADRVTGSAFTYSFPVESPEIHFAYTVPYHESNLKAFLASHDNPAALAVEKLCSSKKGRDVEALRVGRLDGNPAYRVLLTARHHACETMASFVMEGILNAVLADDEDGAWFRRNVEILAIPFMDKDGVEDGDQGKNRRPRDHNRDYIGPSVHPEVAALRTRARNWSNGCLRIALDLHCPHIRRPENERIYLVGSPDEAMWQEQSAFARVMESVSLGPLPYSASNNLAYGQGWNTVANYSGGQSFASWAESIEGLRVSSSLEMPYANAEGSEVTPDTARTFGRALAKRIRLYLESGEPAPARIASPPIAGVFPNLTVMGEGLGSDSEAGIGALMPWAGKLWAVGYVAHIRGQGLGL